MQAMILAAGFGTRLLPYTLSRPKPLFPILNQPLLLLTIRRLQQAGCDHIVVNCHHLREQIVAALHGIPGVVVQEEVVILGTGGGLRKARALFRDEPVLVTNGDIYHTVDYRRLYRHHQETAGVVTMAMHDYPRFNSVSVSAGRVVGFGDQQVGDRLAFTGLHVLDPEVLSLIPAGREYSIIDGYRRLLEEHQQIDALRVDDCFWTDMGTVEDYLALHAGLLTGKIPVWPELADPGRWSPPAEQGGVTPPVSHWISHQARVGSDVIFRDWVCVGEAMIGSHALIQRSVVWDGARVADGSRVVDRLVIQPLEERN